MFNVNQITSQLAKMPDQALQQYAMLHKNDPYTVSLALAESNRRKEMRAGATPMPGQMPKVVDQDIAQMVPPAQQQLPENVGIGQLPAQNMQRMADGGIVGYADRGLVDTNKFVIPPEGFKDPQTGEIIKPESWNALPKSQQMRLVGALRAQAGMAPVPTNAYPGIQYGQYGPSIQQWQQNMQNANPTLAQEREQNMAVVNAQEPSVARGRPTMVNDPRLLTGVSALAAETDTPTTTPPTTGTPPASGSPLAALTPNAGQKIKVGTPAGLPSADEAFNKLLGVMPKEKTVEAENIFTEKRLAPYAEVDAKAADFINKQKDQLKTDKEQEFYMSLIEGGLAAAGEGGPNAIQNIAKGFSKGVGRYGEALKDFRKAAQENSKMELELAKAQADRKVGNMDKYQERVDKADEHNKALAIAKASGLSTLLGQEIHGKYQLASTAMHGQYQMAAAGMPGAQERLFAALGGGNIEKGARLLTEIQAGKRTMAQSYEDYLKAWAGKDTTLGAPLKPHEYAQQIQQLQLAISAPPKPGAATGKVFE